METIYKPGLKAHVSMDDNQIVRYINHTQEYWLSENNTAKATAIDYLRQLSGTLKIPKEQLERLHQKVDYLSPLEQGEEYRQSEEKHQFDSTTLGFEQTYLNVPVWRSGLSVTVKQNPARVAYSANNSKQGINAKMPSNKTIEKYKQMFLQSGLATQGAPGEGQGGNSKTGEDTVSFIESLFTQVKKTESSSKRNRAERRVLSTRFNRGRFYIYKYSAAERLPKQHQQEPIGEVSESEEIHPSISLPAVSNQIKEGQYYMVAEILFSYYQAPYGMLNWRVLVELETGAVLYLRALIDNVNGLVFTQDPITSTGVLTNTAASNNSVLNPLRDDVVLPNLDGPSGGVQSLKGSHVWISDDDAPDIDPPTETAGNDFDYNARTDNFSAVSAYYHADGIFSVIENLGFNLATYFDGTSFPVHVDHRASFGTSDGVEVNAFCGGDGTGDGIGLVGFCLANTADLTNPLGRAVDKYVHWHEIGGHGILWDHVDSPNFGFAHSAGDGLAAIQNDPESMLRALPERFRYAPFRPLRWLNRDVASGWGWGGTNDVGGYSSEEILATTHFRIYRAIGGDSDNLGRRTFASRMATYLILRAVGTLTPGTNPSDALGFCNTLMAVDLLNWTSEGIFGGAYNKVIRWAFEKQGLFQPAGAPTPVVSAGAPPVVDVYINDGRNGEYDYQAVHWNNTSIWNRHTPDGGTSHEPAVLGSTNFAYVKVKNRGTSAASNVVLKGYHCLPGAGLTWRNDFQQMYPSAGLNIANIGANNTEEVIVGPFEWTPNSNVYGHDCMLMIVSADGDPSNIDNFTSGETIEEWRLVPNDNNVGQRNVNLVPGGGGMEALRLALHDHVFFAGNTFRRKANMELKVEMPTVLSEKGWKINFKGVENYTFTLKANERRMMTLDVTAGSDFTKEEIQNAISKDVIITLYANDVALGGMTYRIDPEMKEPANLPGKQYNCKDKAKDLLKCLNIPEGIVKKVCVKKVSLDIEMDSDCSC